MGLYSKRGSRQFGFLAAWVVLAAIAPGMAQAAPVNDGFNGGTKLFGADVAIAGSTVGAGKQAGEPNHAGNGGGHSIWYRWAPPSDDTDRVDTCDSGFDTLLAVYTGSAVDALTPVAANDDGAECGPQSQVVISGDRRHHLPDRRRRQERRHRQLWARPAQNARQRQFRRGEGVCPTPRTPTPPTTSLADQADRRAQPRRQRRRALDLVPLDAVASGPSLDRPPAARDFDTLLAVYTGTSVNALTPVAANDDGAGCGPQSKVTFYGDRRHHLPDRGRWQRRGRRQRQAQHARLADKRQLRRCDDLRTAPPSFESTNNVLAARRPASPITPATPAGTRSGIASTASGIWGLDVDTCGCDFDTLLAVYRFSMSPEVRSSIRWNRWKQRRWLRLEVCSLVCCPAVRPGRPNRIQPSTTSPSTARTGRRGTWRSGCGPPGERRFRRSAPIEVGATAAGYNTAPCKEAASQLTRATPGRSSVWYRWTAPFSGPVALDTCGSDFDTLLAVYTGTA